MDGKGDNLTANQQDCGDSVAINRPCVAHQICKGGGKAYNQINGGSANGDAFVNWHLTTGLSLQVARTAIFILLRVDHVQCHVTPPQYLSCLYYRAFIHVTCVL